MRGHVTHVGVWDGLVFCWIIPSDVILICICQPMSSFDLITVPQFDLFVNKFIKTIPDFRTLRFIKMFQTSKWHQCSHEQWWINLPGDQGWVLSCYQTELKSLSVNKDTYYWNDKRKRNSIASFRCLLPQLDSPTILSGSVLVREKMWDMMTILLKQKVGQM